MTLRAQRDERGFTLIEMLVTVIIFGILVAVAVPATKSIRVRSWDTSVQSDMRTLKAGADQHFNTLFYYPTTPAGFAQSGDTPKVDVETTWRSFVVRAGANAGYVIFAKNNNSPNVFVLSSYDGDGPKDASLTALPDAPPTSGQYGIPAKVTPSAWHNTAPVGSDIATASAIVPFLDSTFASRLRGVLSVGSMGAIQEYSNPTTAWRIVDDPSPVADRAIEFVTDIPGSMQGVWVMPAEPASSWPVSIPAIGAAGETWTVSVWVKASPGVTARLGARIVNSHGLYVTSSPLTTEQMTGEWKRVKATFTTTADMVDSYVSVQVTHGAPYPAGQAVRFTAPQIEKRSDWSPFSRQ